MELKREREARAAAHAARDLDEGPEPASASGLKREANDEEMDRELDEGENPVERRKRKADGGELPAREKKDKKDKKQKKL